MNAEKIHMVTGAYGYSGKYIAGRLLDRGCRVRTLTNSPQRSSQLGDAVPADPFHFDQPDKLAKSLEGVAVLYNTYWVRFNHPTFTFADAVRNSRTLFDAARRAGVGRIVHVSITNPSKDSPFEYFRGKAEVEDALHQSGVPYSILRPAILFGKEDILVNNMAWMLRWFPIVAIFGKGDYKLQPIHVDDLAALAVEEGLRKESTSWGGSSSSWGGSLTATPTASSTATPTDNSNIIINAIGPETFTYRGLIEEIGRIIGKWRLIVPVPPWFGYLSSRVLGKMLGDVVVTRDEIGGLMANLLYVDAPPAGTTKLTDWARQNADQLGRRYANELSRRLDRKAPYS